MLIRIGASFVGGSGWRSQCAPFSGILCLTHAVRDRFSSRFQLLELEYRAALDDDKHAALVQGLAKVARDKDQLRLINQATSEIKFQRLQTAVHDKEEELSARLQRVQTAAQRREEELNEELVMAKRRERELRLKLRRAEDDCDHLSREVRVCARARQLPLLHRRWVHW